MILDRHEAERLVADCDLLAWKLAHRAKRLNAGRGELDDYHAAAMLGFWVAATKYDPARGTKFVTVAIPCARGELRGLIHNEASRGIHTPFHLGPVQVGVDFDIDPDRTAATEPAERSTPDPAAFWSAVKAVMPNRHQRRAVGWTFRRRLTPREIAAETGANRKAEEKRLRDGLAYLRRHGADRLAQFVA